MAADLWMPLKVNQKGVHFQSTTGIILPQASIRAFLEYRVYMQACHSNKTITQKCTLEFCIMGGFPGPGPILLDDEHQPGCAFDPITNPLNGERIGHECCCARTIKVLPFVYNIWSYQQEFFTGIARLLVPTNCLTVHDPVNICETDEQPFAVD